MWQQDDKKKKKKQQTAYTNPFEAFEDLGKGISDQVVDQAKGGVGEAAKQIFGGDLFHIGNHKGGELKPGQELDLKAAAAQKAQQQEQQKQLEKKANHIAPALDYVGEILHSHEKQTATETQKLREEIQNLILEVKSIAGASSALEKQVTEATGGNVVNPGKYHVTFFKWIIALVRDARQKIDNANVWLSTVKSKKGAGAGGKPKKGMNYWDMAKKYGNDFTMSGERGVSTQNG